MHFFDAQRRSEEQELRCALVGEEKRGSYSRVKSQPIASACNKCALVLNTYVIVIQQSWCNCCIDNLSDCYSITARARYIGMPCDAGSLFALLIPLFCRHFLNNFFHRKMYLLLLSTLVICLFFTLEFSGE